MKYSIRTYLSGSLSQHPLNPSTNFWTIQDESILKNIFKDRNIELDILNPNDMEFQGRSDLFKYELEYIDSCDFILVELSERRGIGVGIEIYHAYLKKIPVLSICPDITYYKDSTRGYFHPFLQSIITRNFESKVKLYEFLRTY